MLTKKMFVNYLLEQFRHSKTVPNSATTTTDATAVKMSNYYSQNLAMMDNQSNLGKHDS